MPVTSGSKIQFEYMLGGGSAPILMLGEQTDTTGWVQGYPLALDASGHVYAVTTGNIASAVDSTGGVIGIAGRDSDVTATVDGATVSPVIMATWDTVFSAVVAHATTASAVVQSAQRGNAYFLTASGTVCASSKVMIMDLAATGNVGAYVIGNKDATGTAYGRNYFIFKACWSSNSPFISAT